MGSENFIPKFTGLKLVENFVGNGKSMWVSQEAIDNKGITSKEITLFDSNFSKFNSLRIDIKEEYLLNKSIKEDNKDFEMKVIRKAAQNNEINELSKLLNNWKDNDVNELETN